MKEDLRLLMKANDFIETLCNCMWDKDYSALEEEELLEWLDDFGEWSKDA